VTAATRFAASISSAVATVATAAVGVNNKRHFFFCCCLYESRATLLQRISALVQQCEQAWSQRLTHHCSRIDDSSENEQPRILCSNTHTLLRTRKTNQHHFPVLPIEVGQLMQQHRAHPQFLGHILLPK
jgi:hypothetical protein